MKRTMLFIVTVMSMAVATISAKAGEPIKADFGADLVSSYVWRGQKLDGAAIQPSLGIEWGGLSISAWGSTGITVFDNRELDLTLAYSIGGFTIGITDYFCADSATKFFYYKPDTPHVAEVNLGYDFGPVAVNWYTNVLGAVGENASGNKAYSSYVEVSAPFTLGGIDWSAALGASPWGNDFYGTKGFGVVCASLTASKELELGSFSLPVFAQIMANPCENLMFFTFGLSF